MSCCTRRGVMSFLSTPSARRATDSDLLISVEDDISIHALREEGDMFGRPVRSPYAYFYPRPPRGGRPAHLRQAAPDLVISIHALREEGDGAKAAIEDADEIFLSTPSARRATGCILCGERSRVHFYPRPPRGGRRSGRKPSASNSWLFLSTPSARRATYG